MRFILKIFENVYIYPFIFFWICDIIYKILIFNPERIFIKWDF